MLTDEDKKWIDENVKEDPTISHDPDVFPDEDDESIGIPLEK